MLLLTGCWSYRDIEDRAIIAGAAIDIDESGQILLTAETVTFPNDEQAGKSEILTGTGKNISDTLTHLLEKSGKELYWHHATLIILSESFARQGIEELLDYILNDNEVRLTLKLAVSRLETAREVFELECYGSQIKSYALTGIIQESEKLGSTPKRQAYDNINGYLENGLEMIMPQIYMESEGGSDRASVEGCALFKSGKFAGWLDKDMTEMLLILRQESDTLELDIEADGSQLALNTYGWSADNQVELKNGAYDVKTKISANYEIMLVNGDINVNDESSIEKIGTALSELVKKRVTLLSDTLKSYKTDAASWGNNIYKKTPTKTQNIDTGSAVEQSKLALSLDFTNKSGSDSIRPTINTEG